MPDGESVFWSPELIVKHQSQDPVFKEIIEWVKTGSKPEWPGVAQMSSMIKYWWSRFDTLRLAPDTKVLEMSWISPSGGMRYRTLVPYSLRKCLLREWHDTLQGGHLGSNKTWNRAKRSGFFWNSMRLSVREHVRECLICQKNKPRGMKKNHPVIPLKTGHKFELVGMDLVGPLPRTERRNRYMLVIVDYWTRWCEAIPIPNKESATVAGAFMRVWVSRYGCPMSILSDQGKEFDSALFKECCTLMDSWKVRTSPFHPRCNGLTERLNQTIERMLAAFVADNQLDWDEKLPFVMMAYRSAVQESTGVTPHSMMFGDELPVPLDWVFGSPKSVPQDKVLYVKELRSKIQSAYEMARKSLLSAILRQKRSYDKGVKNVNFKVGDFVMCHDKTKKLHRNPALRPKWRGPYIVINKLSPANCTIQLNAGAKPVNVHVDRLKHCFPQRKANFKWAIKLLKMTHPDVIITFRDEEHDQELSELNPRLSAGSNNEREIDSHKARTEGENSDQLQGSGLSSLVSSTDEVSDSNSSKNYDKELYEGRKRKKKRLPKYKTKYYSDTSESEEPSLKKFLSPRRQKRKPVPTPRNIGGEKEYKPIPAPRKYKRSMEKKPIPAPRVTRGGRRTKPPERFGFFP